MIHPTYIARKLAINEGGQLIWRLNPDKGRPAAHDRGEGPVVRLLGHDYPEAAVVDALLKGQGLTEPKPASKGSNRPLPKSGHRGIHAAGRGRFIATYCCDGQKHYVGTFLSLEEAIAARDKFVSK